MERQKNFNIELLRSLGVIAVIVIHMTMKIYHNDKLYHDDFSTWIYSSFYYSLTRFCVPIFFIISTYLVFNSINSNPAWKEKLVRIGVPYIFWSAVYYIYNGGDDFIEFVKLSTTSTTSFHLWFLPVFLGFSILLPAIKKIFSGDDYRKFTHIAVFIVCFSIVLPSVIYVLNIFHGGFDFLYGLNSYGMTLPLYLSYAFAFPFLHRKVNVLKCSAYYIILIVLAVLINLVISFKIGKPSEFFYQYTTPLVFLSSFLFFNIIMSIDFSKISIVFSKIIYSVGACSFGIYLVHWLVYILLKRVGLFIDVNPVANPLINSFTVFVSSYFLVLAIRNIRVIKKIV